MRQLKLLATASVLAISLFSNEVYAVDSDNEPGDSSALPTSSNGVVAPASLVESKPDESEPLGEFLKVSVLNAMDQIIPEEEKFLYRNGSSSQYSPLFLQAFDRAFLDQTSGAGNLVDRIKGGVGMLLLVEAQVVNGIEVYRLKEDAREKLVDQLLQERNVEISSGMDETELKDRVTDVIEKSKAAIFDKIGINPAEMRASRIEVPEIDPTAAAGLAAEIPMPSLPVTRQTAVTVSLSSNGADAVGSDDDAKLRMQLNTAQDEIRRLKEAADEHTDAHKMADEAAATLRTDLEASQAVVAAKQAELVRFLERARKMRAALDRRVARRDATIKAQKAELDSLRRRSTGGAESF